MVKLKKIWPLSPRREMSLLFILGIILFENSVADGQEELGFKIGKLSELQHGVKGTVYAPDNDHLFITDFHYNGDAPAAHFWVGVTASPDKHGTIVPFPDGKTEPLTSEFNGVMILLTLPEKRKISDIKYVSVWCSNAESDFGSVTVDFKNIKFIKPVTIGSFNSPSGQVKSGNASVTTTRVIKVPGFTFDGEANPKTFIWAGNSTTMDSSTGKKVAMMDNMKEIEPLGKYDNNDITLVLMDGLSFIHVRWLIVYEMTNKTTFGVLVIPANLKLQVDTKTLRAIARAPPTVTHMAAGFLTCLSALFTAIIASTLIPGGLELV